LLLPYPSAGVLTRDNARRLPRPRRTPLVSVAAYTYPVSVLLTQTTPAGVSGLQRASGQL
jgi:hypothetical protein